VQVGPGHQRGGRRQQLNILLRQVFAQVDGPLRDRDRLEIAAPAAKGLGPRERHQADRGLPQQPLDGRGLRRDDEDRRLHLAAEERLGGLRAPDFASMAVPERSAINLIKESAGHGL